MAANQNSRGGTNSGFGGTGQSPFFSQSLGGGLTVDSLSGPLLFTPVPLSPPIEPAVDQRNVSGTSEMSMQSTPFQAASQSQPAVFQPAEISPSQESTDSFAPAPFQSAPSSSAAYQSNPYMTSPLSQSQTIPQHPEMPLAVHESYNSIPGMQYMDMPFDGQVPTQLPSSASLSEPQLSTGSRPMQVVTPQPQQTHAQPGRPQFFTPSGHPINAFTYHPVQAHWFYYNLKKTWMPFSFIDSRNLEAAFKSKNKATVHTHGGRYDVDLDSLTREAVYWKEQKTDVRRCTWFYRGESEVRLIPYDGETAEALEKEYKLIVENGFWNRKMDFPNGDTVIFHNANVIVHYTKSSEPDVWTGEDSKMRPKVVRRGISDIADEIVEGEPDQIDHLIFVVHGIGPAADLKLRPIVECVDDMRQQGLMQMGTHQFVKEGFPVGRVEYLPIEWYSKLHSDRHGVDNRLNAITLPSIVKFRSFTNETLTDILFFTSPMYCQAICDTVVSEMNRLLQVFKGRNPSFQGEVSVCGHSLGSCILFDILANQANIPPKESLYEVVEEVIEGNTDEIHESPATEEDSIAAPPAPPPVLSKSLSEVFASTVQEDDIPDIDVVLKKLSLTDLSSKFHEERVDTETLLMCSEADIKDLGIPMGPRKKLMGFVREQAQIQEKKKSQEAAKAPVKTHTSIAESTQTKSHHTNRRPVIMKGTQTNFFRSYSSSSVEIAYERGVAGTGQPTVNYSKLDFQPAHMFALGSPVGLFTTVRGVSSLGLNFKLPTCSSFFNIFHPYDPVAYRIEPLVNPKIDIPPVLMPHHKGRKRFHLELRENLTRVGANLKQGFIEAVRSTWETINQFARSHTTETGEEVSETAVVQPLQTQEDVSQDSIDSTDQGVQESLERQLNFGLLNNGKRIDYVLQERPLEVLNEYLFALSSHTCYWTSEDTVLLMLRAIYGAE